MKKISIALLTALVLVGCAPETRSVPNDPAVQTDWSALTSYKSEERIYTRRYAEYTGTLLPAADYGPLVPYLGDRLGGHDYGGSRYGLMTMKGELVTDPVFAHIWRGGLSWGYHDNTILPYLMLSRGAISHSEEEWPEESRWAMAAPDGSWVTEFKYTMDGELVTWGREASLSCTEEGLFVLDGDALVYLDGADGKERFRLEGLPRDELWSILYTAMWHEGTVYFSYAEGPSQAVDAQTGMWKPITQEKYEAIRQIYQNQEFNPDDFLWGELRFRQTEGDLTIFTADGSALVKGDDLLRYGYLERGYDWVTGESYLRVPTKEGHVFYDQRGKRLALLPARLPGDGTSRVTLAGGCFLIEEQSFAGLREFDGDWIFRYPLPTGEWD